MNNFRNFIDRIKQQCENTISITTMVSFVTLMLFLGFIIYNLTLTTVTESSSAMLSGIFGNLNCINKIMQTADKGTKVLPFEEYANSDTRNIAERIRDEINGNPAKGISGVFNNKSKLTEVFIIKEKTVEENVNDKIVQVPYYNVVDATTGIKIKYATGTQQEDGYWYKIDVNSSQGKFNDVFKSPDGNGYLKLTYSDLQSISGQKDINAVKIKDYISDGSSKGKPDNYTVIKVVSDYGYYVYLLLEKDNFADKIKENLSLFIILGLILSLIFAYLLSRSISTPLNKMEEQLSKITSGDLSGRLDYTRFYEVNKLINSYNLMADSMQRMYSSLEAEVANRTKELKKANSELKNTQAMMIHSEKMKSLGELVAGIMHEINNPINFIYGNMVHLGNYSNDLISLIDEYSKFDDTLSAENKKDVTDMKSEMDYEFLKSDLPDLIKSCKEGADRAKNIIQDLKSFSRMEEVAVTTVDLNHEVEMTLNILHNKIKNKAEIHKDFSENLPHIEAFGGQLNQVFMNILDNAVGAIPEKGDIWIRINPDKENKNILIEIEDNGEGMNEETARKIFNPFFTTKPVGKGTGLGLSITYRIIKSHGGSISVKSKPGEGTTFKIKLPIKLNKEALTSASTGERNG